MILYFDDYTINSQLRNKGLARCGECGKNLGYGQGWLRRHISKKRVRYVCCECIENHIRESNLFFGVSNIGIGNYAERRIDFPHLAVSKEKLIEVIYKESADGKFILPSNYRSRSIAFTPFKEARCPTKLI